MSFVPLSEGSGIDLYNRRFRQCICSDKFVVGSVIDDDDNTGLACYSFRSPREIAAIESQSTEFLVASTSSDEMDSLVSDTCVCWLTTFLESSEGVLIHDTIGNPPDVVTFSYGSRRALHQWRPFCVLNHERYPSE